MAHKNAKPIVKEKPETKRAGICAPQWLSQAAANAPRAMLCGDEYLVVENCGQLAEFTPDCVRLATAQGCMQIEGSDLTISRESEHTAIVRGKIDRVSLCDA